MRFQVHLRLEDHKFLRHTLLVQTQEMVLSKMLLKGFVVDIILRIAAVVPPVADVAFLMFLSAVNI